MTNYLDMIENYLVAGNVPRERNGHNPSSASMVTLNGGVEGECLRKLFYSYSGEPVTNPIEPKGLLRMYFGNVLHGGLDDLLGTIFKEQGLGLVDGEVSAEVNLEGLTRPLRARADDIVTDPAGVKTGIEFKFTFGKGGLDLKKYGAKPSWIMQSQLTMHAFELKNWSVVAIDFPSMYRAQFDLAYDFQMVSAMIGRMKLLELALEKKIEPPRDFDKDKNWQCAYPKLKKGEPDKRTKCPYFDKCWGESK